MPVIPPRLARRRTRPPVTGRRRRAAALAAAVTAVAGGSVLLPVGPPASAATATAPDAGAGECLARPAQKHKDWTSMLYTGDMVCSHDLDNTRVQSTTQSPVNGQMLFSPSWFVCWKPGTPLKGSDIWYYTQADTVTGNKQTKGWGYLHSSALKVTQHPVPGLPRCRWGEE
ncbi:hypothetical protein [Streptomyces griseocarneus]|uniref:hypothetical protein n=1 Tax=Streptomyces griseocarneus TaxID=51201 RepID=UPI00167CD663|nr:hypothetical protein [Streptomyces griseocarneus]MBZ6477979.1 hypothetical protein [Streptomyces griseocarneus]GHG54617.1 hypothetical protein GCM10018779_17720 [Streptomyces griseocarneus]